MISFAEDVLTFDGPPGAGPLCAQGAQDRDAHRQPRVIQPRYAELRCELVAYRGGIDRAGQAGPPSSEDRGVGIEGHAVAGTVSAAPTAGAVRWW
jgi:hypothetical protein